MTAMTDRLSHAMKMLPEINTDCDIDRENPFDVDRDFEKRAFDDRPLITIAQYRRNEARARFRRKEKS